MLRMRYGVVGVFQNNEGKLMLCQRAKEVGAWQFPQGGIDPGETPLNALKREMHEELGTDAFEICIEGKATTQYLFPKDLKSSIVQKYDGQIHHWFLLRFKDNHGPDLKRSDGEFNAFKWVDVNDAIPQIVAWKQQAYSNGLKILNLVDSF